MTNRMITAHQLAVGMTIRCPVDGDKITITELHATSSMRFSIECKKGGCGFNVNDTFELLEPFDLTTVNLNWISEQMAYIEESHITNSMQDLAWGTEQDPAKAEIEITPYRLNGVTYELISEAESIVLKNDTFKSFFDALLEDKALVRLLVVDGDLQTNSERMDGTPYLSALLNLQAFSKHIQPLLNPDNLPQLMHWIGLGCKYINIDFLQMRIGQWRMRNQESEESL
ncbi:hypothetical protein [Vibrio chagasii]|uniref:hypothetical protein n=1 Tax=Vibrio chagasii TaxID=170679 RepID=UPI0037368C61